jgi:hypothetical protein
LVLWCSWWNLRHTIKCDCDPTSTNGSQHLIVSVEGSYYGHKSSRVWLRFCYQESLYTWTWEDPNLSVFANPLNCKIGCLDVQALVVPITLCGLSISAINECSTMFTILNIRVCHGHQLWIAKCWKEGFQIYIAHIHILCPGSASLSIYLFLGVVDIAILLKFRKLLWSIRIFPSFL